MSIAAEWMCRTSHSGTYRPKRARTPLRPGDGRDKRRYDEPEFLAAVVSHGRGSSSRQLQPRPGEPPRSPAAIDEARMIGTRMVGGRGIEPLTPSMSRKCSSAELTARSGVDVASRPRHGQGRAGRRSALPLNRLAPRMRAKPASQDAANQNPSRPALRAATSG